MRDMYEARGRFLLFPSSVSFWDRQHDGRSKSKMSTDFESSHGPLRTFRSPPSILACKSSTQTSSDTEARRGGADLFDSSRGAPASPHRSDSVLHASRKCITKNNATRYYITTKVHGTNNVQKSKFLSYIWSLKVPYKLTSLRDTYYAGSYSVVI